MRKFVSFLCVFLYFASPYRLFGYPMPELLGLVGVLLLVKSNPKVIIPPKYTLFFIYMVFIPVCVSFITGLPGNYIKSILPFGIILFTLNLCVLTPATSPQLILRYYRYLVFIAIGYFIFQELSVILIGYRPTFYIPFLEMYYEDMKMTDFSESRMEIDRSSSFFLEPAHFVQYIIPYYCIKVSNCLQGHKIDKETILLTLVMLWIRSGCGYFVLSVIFIYLLLSNKNIKISYKIIMSTTVVSSVAIILFLLKDNPYILHILNRMSEFSTDVDASGPHSGFLRIWRGYFIYGIMPFLSKIFGVGPGSLDYVCSLYVNNDAGFEGTYMNGIQSLLCIGGIFGLALFLVFLVHMYKKLSLSGRIIIISMMALFFIENMLFSPKMFLYILIAYNISSYEHNKSRKKISRYINIQNK